MGNLMKKIIRKLFGITKLEEEKEALKIARDKAVAETVLAQQKEEQAKLTPKERATSRGESWVAVLDTKVNKDNVRNGFFELDWNEYFITELKKAGYGFDGDPDEEIVDRWFRELCANVVIDGDLGGPVNTGVIDINSVRKNNL
jgi:hypothetical protein